MKDKKNKYVVGVDGGGTKTVAALADLRGKILRKSRTGSANPRNVGLSVAVANVARAIKEILPKNKKILVTFLGLPTLEEEFKDKKAKIKRELLKYSEISSIFKGKVIIDSDQISGFRAGIEEKDGIFLNAGSGSVAHGWRGRKEAKVCGWGYLSEMGSAFWVGQEGLRAVWQNLDGRGPKTLITNLIFRNLKVKNKEDLIKKIYSKNPIEAVAPISILVNEAGKKNDKIAKDILIKAGQELALTAKTAIKKLSFQKTEFPVVLTGSMFNSKIISETVKKEIKKFAPQAKFILPKAEPVVGAVKMAMRNLKWKS